MIFIVFVVLFTAWCVISLIRIEIVHQHLQRRIKEIFASNNWYKYELDISGTYDLALWDYRKWTYRQFFHVVVPSNDSTEVVK